MIQIGYGQFTHQVRLLAGTHIVKNAQPRGFYLRCTTILSSFRCLSSL